MLQRSKVKSEFAKGVKNPYRVTPEMIMSRCLADYANAPYSYRAIYELYSGKNTFAPNNTLPTKKAKRITVADVLSAVSYAKSIAETMGVRVNDKYSVALRVLKSIDLVLKNNKDDKPINKALHLANDVFTEIAKKAVDGKQSGQIISGLSLLLDLTIDFAVEE